MLMWKEGMTINQEVELSAEPSEAHPTMLLMSFEGYLPSHSSTVLKPVASCEGGRWGSLFKVSKLFWRC